MLVSAKNEKVGCTRDALKFGKALQNFTCKRCQGQLDKNLDERITLDGDDIETVDSFFYLENVLSTERGVQEDAISRIKSAWKKFKDVTSILCEIGT